MAHQLPIKPSPFQFERSPSILESQHQISKRTMAASGIDSSLFTSEQVLEEMGSVLVYLSKAKICLLRNLETDEVFLPTIRRFVSGYKKDNHAIPA